MTIYTLVQHSGYTEGNDPLFQRAVETRGLAPNQVEKVRKAGGLIFETYEAAEAAEMEENYPPEVEGLIPSIKGSFHAIVYIQGAPLYIPLISSTQPKEGTDG